MAARKASGSAKDKLAVVLTGNAARAAAHLGALEALEAAGLAPAVVVGVSGGAVAAALYAAGDSAGAAREALYACAEAASWQDLTDVDYQGALDLMVRPYEVNGLVRGEALQQALLASPVGHRGFQHLETALFVVACDLNSGREVVFGNQSAEDAPDAPYQLFAKTAQDLERANIATAVRASCLVPGLCRPLDLDHLCLVDGSLRQRRALAVAATQPGVARILWLHAGLDENETFSLVTDYVGQSFAAALGHAMTVLGAEQFDPHTGDPALEGKALRFVNLATASVGAFDLTRVQQVYESGRRTVAAILAQEPCAGGNGLFTADAAAIAGALAEEKDEAGQPRWEAVIGAGGRNVLSITDCMPPLQQEFGYEFDEYLNQSGRERIAAKDPAGTTDWALAAAEAQLGLGRLVQLHFGRFCWYAWKAIWGGLGVAWQALRLDTAWKRLVGWITDGTMAAIETLSRKKPAGGA